MGKSKKAKKAHRKAKDGAPPQDKTSAAQAPRIPTAAKQKEIVKQLMDQSDEQGMQVGDKRYVLPYKWWQRWCEYVDYHGEAKDSSCPAPGKIMNLALLTQPPESVALDDLVGGPLRRNLREGFHYQLVPGEVWQALEDWYGGGPTVARFVIEDGDAARGNTMKRVQLYPDLEGEEKQEEDVVEKEGKDEGPSACNGHVKASPPARVSSIPKECGACKALTGKLMRCGNCQLIWYCGASCQRSHWKFHRDICRSAESIEDKEARILDGLESERRGKMGLRNLGNTCFMNSALQCLSHVEVITEFFLSNRYVQDLNADNPLGTGGNLATEYSDLLRELYFGTASHTAPSSLKRAISRFAPQFSGFQQHDSQELLAYLIDGLHEDLNRVKKKPYIETKESDGKTDDAIVAKEAWKRHLLRNDSIFVDYVQGQFKSTVVCPICSKVSITFDPFNCVQLELPSKQTRRLEVIVVPIGQPLMRYWVDVPKKASILGLKKLLSKMSGIVSDEMVVADIYQSMIFKIWGDVDRVSRIRDGDRTLVYQVERSFGGKSKEGCPEDAQEDTEEPGLEEDESGMDEGVHYGVLIHRSEGGMCGDPLLFSYHAKSSCLEVLERWCKQLEAQITPNTDNLPKPIPAPILAQAVYLCNRDGVYLRQEPIPARADVLFKDYVSTTESVFDDGYVSLSVAWSASALSDVRTYMPHIPVIRNHESVKMDEDDGGGDSINLYDCFRNFTKPETLDQANLWYCSSCKEHRQARKTMEIWKLPDVLIVSLKRFEYRNEILRDKIDMFVDFPLENLYMAPFCLQKVADESDLCYDLFAVDNHYGGMGFGHYTAFARSWSDTKYPGWFSFDDSRVSPAMPSQVKSNAAYILFYKRRNMKYSKRDALRPEPPTKE